MPHTRSPAHGTACGAVLTRGARTGQLFLLPLHLLPPTKKLTQVFYLPCLNFGQGTNQVITMEMLGRIRQVYLRDEVSLHEITSRTGLSRNTVRRWQRTPEAIQNPTPPWVNIESAGWINIQAALTQASRLLKAGGRWPRRARPTLLPSSFKRDEPWPIRRQPRHQRPPASRPFDTCARPCCGRCG